MRWGLMGMRRKLQSACGGLAVAGALAAGAVSGAGVAAARPVHPSHPHSITSDAGPVAKAHIWSGHARQRSELVNTSHTVASTSPPEQSLAVRSLEVPAQTTPARVELLYDKTPHEQFDERLAAISEELEALRAERETADPARQAEIDARVEVLKDDYRQFLFIFQEYHQSYSAIRSDIRQVLEAMSQELEQ